MSQSQLSVVPLWTHFYFAHLNQPAKGRTNIELREQFILADGVSQSMTAFKSKPSPNSTNVSSQGGSGQRGSFSGTAGPITKVRKQPLRWGNRWGFFRPHGPNSFLHSPLATLFLFLSVHKNPYFFGPARGVRLFGRSGRPLLHNSKYPIVASSLLCLEWLFEMILPTLAPEFYIPI